MKSRFPTDNPRRTLTSPTWIVSGSWIVVDRFRRFPHKRVSLLLSFYLRSWHSLACMCVSTWRCLHACMCVFVCVCARALVLDTKDWVLDAPPPYPRVSAHEQPREPRKLRVRSRFQHRRTKDTSTPGNSPSSREIVQRRQSLMALAAGMQMAGSSSSLHLLWKKRSKVAWWRCRLARDNSPRTAVKFTSLCCLSWPRAWSLHTWWTRPSAAVSTISPLGDKTDNFLHWMTTRDRGTSYREPCDDFMQKIIMTENDSGPPHSLWQYFPPALLILCSAFPAESKIFPWFLLRFSYIVFFFSFLFFLWKKKILFLLRSVSVCPCSSLTFVATRKKYRIEI